MCAYYSQFSARKSLEATETMRFNIRTIAASAILIPVFISLGIQISVAIQGNYVAISSISTISYDYKTCILHTSCSSEGAIIISIIIQH